MKKFKLIVLLLLILMLLVLGFIATHDFEPLTKLIVGLSGLCCLALLKWFDK